MLSPEIIFCGELINRSFMLTINRNIELSFEGFLASSGSFFECIVFMNQLFSVFCMKMATVVAAKLAT